MLSKTETALLRALENDARLSFAELGEKVGLSKTPCWSRVQELEKLGVIKGYRAEIDPAALGLQIHAFVQVTIDSAKHVEFEAAINRHPSVVQCFATAGDGDYLIQVLVPGIADLDVLLRTEISRLPGVQRIVTTVCVKTIKHRTSIVDCVR
ncbi:MAG TPA: Lrp/AsnC family transcriptional regulator [Steroidobacter sp.]|uniref:Lrp/AsnC family transcriptional regulator n=1 Tax=Steroidobacter sp. TaxID=1978227 RepID=UPI002ED894D0